MSYGLIHRYVIVIMTGTLLGPRFRITFEISYPEKLMLLVYLQ